MNKKIWKIFQNIFRKLFNIKSTEEQAADLISEIENQAESVEPFSYGLVSSTETREKEMGFRLNVSEGQANYSQRKSKYVHEQKGQYGTNRIDWKCVCNVHALAMAFLYSGWIFPKSTYEREPDALADFIVNECLRENNWFKQKMPQLWRNWYEGAPDAYSPLELHDVLAHYSNEFFGCSKADTFTTVADVKDVFKYIYENNIAIPTSVKWGGLLGHVITIVGFEATSEDDLLKWIKGGIEKCPVVSIYYDDPWGYLDAKTNKYDGSKSGNDNVQSYDFFVAHWKPVDNKNKKFAHFISKPVSLV